MVQPMGEVISTTAELFPDCAIDLLGNRQLVCFQGDCGTIAPVIQYNGRDYCAANLDSSLEDAIRLPFEAADYASTESLVQDISDTSREMLGAGDNHALILATTVLSTWVPECLPGGAPVLNVWGQAVERAVALPFIAALCRRPLELVDASIDSLAGLPRGLHPTVILNDPSEVSLRKLLSAVGQLGAGVLRGGRFLAPRFSLVVFTQLPSPLITLSIPLSALVANQGLTPKDVGERTYRFPPQLLRYRLMRHQAIAKSRFGADGFAPGVGRLARQLGAPVEGSENLQSRIVTALHALDEEKKFDSCQSEEAVAIEATLLPCHEQKPSVFIRELSEIANTILVERGERALFTPKQLGAILRRFAIPTKRQAPGFELTFDPSMCRRLHEIGRRLGVLALSKPFQGCHYCVSIFPKETGVE